MRRRTLMVTLYFIVVLALAGFSFVFIGKDLMPKINTGQFQLRQEPFYGYRGAVGVEYSRKAIFR